MLIEKANKNYNVISKLAIIITLLLCVVNLANVSETLKVFVGLVFLAVILLLPSGESIKYLMFILCANELLNIGSTSLTMIFVAMFFATRCLFSLKKLRVDGALSLSVILLVFVGIISYAAVNSNEALVTTLKHMLFLYYIAYVLNDNRGKWKELYASSFRYIAAGIVCFSILTVAFKGSPSLLVRFTFSEEVTINFIGIVCALSVVNLLYIRLILLDKSKFDIALLIGCTAVGIITLSRSFILGTALGLVLLLFLSPSLKWKLKFLVSCIACVIVGIIVISAVPLFAEYFDTAVKRITAPSGDDISNGRYDLWSMTIASMKENGSYFWLGAGNFINVGAEWGDKINVAHNLFLETWVIYGVLGCLVLLALHTIFIKHCVFGEVRKKIKMVSLVPILVLLACLFYSHHFMGRSMSIVFVFSFLPMVIGARDEKEDF